MKLIAIYKNNTYAYKTSFGRLYKLKQSLYYGGPAYFKIQT